VLDSTKRKIIIHYLLVESHGKELAKFQNLLQLI